MPVESHRYEFSARDVAKKVGPSIGAFLLLLLGLHLISAADLIPRARLCFDMDSTVIGHQSRAAKAGGDHDILLVGDSSCLMGVQADLMRDLTGLKVLSLATLSYLDLTSYGRLVEAFCGASAEHGSPLKSVVLLMHPDALRRAGVSERHLGLLAAGLEGRPAEALDWVESVCGVPIIRDRLLGPWLPRILPGEYGVEFGFSMDLSQHMRRHAGSALDPGRFVYQEGGTKTEHRLAASVRDKSLKFRSKLPGGVRLYVGITPVPRSLAGENYEAKTLERLDLWGLWLKADGILRGLPLVLPDDQFASASHLRGSSAAGYTRRLAEAISAMRLP